MNFLFLYIADNIILSTIRVMLFHMKKPLRLVPLADSQMNMPSLKNSRSAYTTILYMAIHAKPLIMM